MDLKETFLSRNEIYRGHIIDLHVDTVRLPNGHESTREVADHPGGVAVVALDESDNVLTVKQYRYVFSRVLEEIPAGKLEPGEDPCAAALRELKEETGFTGGEWQELMVIAPNSSTMNNHCHCFVARNVEKTSGQHLDATEDLDYFLKDENEVFDMLQRGEFHQAMMVAALWKFFCCKLLQKI